MSELTIDPGELLPNPWNPNRVDPINQEKLENSIRVDGIKLPILVRETDKGLQIIDGFHRVQAAKSIGIEVPVRNLGKISDAAAKKATLIANSRYGENDIDALADLLNSKDFESAEVLLATLPIDETEIASLFASSMDVDLDAELDDLDDLDDKSAEKGIDLASPTKVATHTMVRFKLPIDEAEALQEKIDSIIEEFELTDSDKLIRSGEALLQLLGEGDADE